MTRLLAALLLLAGLAAPAPLAGQATTVILVRHAERAAAPANDPVLTAAGSARAQALLESVRHAGITHILTTTLQRTVLTAAPTAAALGIAPAVIDPRSQNHIADVVAAVRERVGGVILVVGHSNTIPAIVNALAGAARAPEICDSEYDNLYVVTLPSDAGADGARAPAAAPADTPAPAGAHAPGNRAPGVVRARYGVATPVGADCHPMVPVSK